MIVPALGTGNYPQRLLRRAAIPLVTSSFIIFSDNISASLSTVLCVIASIAPTQTKAAGLGIAMTPSP